MGRREGWRLIILLENLVVIFGPSTLMKPAKTIKSGLSISKNSSNEFSKSILDENFLWLIIFDAIL